MLYLDLCKRVHKRCQVQSLFGSVTEAGINGEIAQIVSDCWRDIQQYRKNWIFMQREVTFLTEVGEKEYELDKIFLDPEKKVQRWRTDIPLYLTDPDTGARSKLGYVDYDFSKRYKQTDEKHPHYWTYNPRTLHIIFSNPCDKVYTVEAGYYRTPQILEENADKPHILESWHNIIVEKAVAEFAAAKSIQGLNQKFELLYATSLGELMREQVPSENVQVNEVA